MSRGAQQYADLRAKDGPEMEKKSTVFECFLLSLSTDFSQELTDNLKIFLEKRQHTGSGCLVPSKIEQTKTVFGLLMALVDVGFMTPHDMSKLIDFLNASGENALVKKVQAFQAEAQGELNDCVIFIIENYIATLERNVQIIYT